MFGLDILGDVLLKLLQGLIPMDQVGDALSEASNYMLPAPADFTDATRYGSLVVWMAALGLAVGAGLFGFAVLAAGGLGDARRLVQAVGGLAMCAVAGPATLAVYTLLRDPINDSAARVITDAMTRLLLDTTSGTPGSGQTLLSAMCVVTGVVGFTVAAGILGFGTVLTVILAPVAVAVTVFRGGMSVAIRWAVTFIGLMFAPLIAAFGLAITAGITASATWSPASWIVAMTGMLMSGAAPFVVLSRLQALGLPDLAAGRGSGAGAARGAASAARTVQTVARVVK